MKTNTHITREQARLLADYAIKKAEFLGIHISVTIVDESGNLVHFARMNGAHMYSVADSNKKARTAIVLGHATGAVWSDSQNLSDFNPDYTNDYHYLGGGVPIIVEGQILGAIGISGGHFNQNESCAQYAIGRLDPVD